MTLQSVLKALAVCAISCAVFVPAWAKLGLIETVWIAESEKCAIREIRFFDFGRALVAAGSIGSDEATWKQDSVMVHLYFDHWDGQLDGPIDEEVFKATYTWRSEDTLEQTSIPCSFHVK